MILTSANGLTNNEDTQKTSFFSILYTRKTIHNYHVTQQFDEGTVVRYKYKNVVIIKTSSMGTLNLNSFILHQNVIVSYRVNVRDGE